MYKCFCTFGTQSFLAMEVCSQRTWTCWMKSVVCFDKSLLIGRNALRTCENAISLLWLAIRIFQAGFLMKKTVSKSQYVYNKVHSLGRDWLAVSCTCILLIDLTYLRYPYNVRASSRAKCSAWRVRRQKFTCWCNFNETGLKPIARAISAKKNCFERRGKPQFRRAITFSQKDFIIGQLQKRCVSFSCTSLKKSTGGFPLFVSLSPKVICWQSPVQKFKLKFTEFCASCNFGT